MINSILQRKRERTITKLYQTHSAFACTLTANIIDDQLPMKQFSVFRVECQLLWKNIIDIVADKYYFSKSIQELSTTTDWFIELLLAWVHCLAWKIKKVSSCTWYSRDDPYTSYGNSSESCIRKDERIKPQTRLTSASIKAWWESVLFEMWNCNCSERLPGHFVTLGVRKRKRRQ